MSAAILAGAGPNVYAAFAPPPSPSKLKPDLKPCPFCGGASHTRHFDDLGWRTGCSNVGLSCDVVPFTPIFSSEDHAVAAWNKRDDTKASVIMKFLDQLAKHLLPRAEAHETLTKIKLYLTK